VQDRDAEPWTFEQARAAAEAWKNERSEEALLTLHRGFARLEVRRLAGDPLDDQSARIYVTCATALAKAPPDSRRTELGAIELLERALEVAESLSERWTIYVEPRLAEARLDGGRVQDDIDHLEALGDRYLEAWPYTALRLKATLADCYRYQGRRREALAHIEAVRAQLEGAPLEDADRTSLTFSLTACEGQAYLDLGVLDQAARCYDACAGIARGPDGDVFMRAEVRLQHARLLLASDRYQELIAGLDEALADDTLAEYRGEFLFAQGSALSILEEEGSAPAGRAESRLLEALEEGLPGGDRLSAELEIAELQLRAGGNDREVDRRLDRVEREVERAFAHDESHWRGRLATLRSRSSLARGAPRAELEQRRADLELAFRQQLAEWDAAPARAGELGFLRYSARQEVLGELVALALHLEGEEPGTAAALGYLMEARSRGTIARTLAGDDPALAELARGTDALAQVRADLLGPGRGVLVYLPGDRDRSVVFAIDGERAEAIPLPPEWHWLPPTADLQRALRRALLTPGVKTAYEDWTVPLARDLLPERVQRRLESWSAVTIVGGDLLGDVPFEMLPLVGRRALGLELAVDYLPSLYLGCVLARSQPAPRRLDAARTHLTVLAAPAEAGPQRFAPLPWEDDRAGPWRASYGRSSVRVVTGAEANAGALADPRTAASDVLHLIVHGDYDGTWERPAGLVLAPDAGDPDGRLWAPDLERLRVPELVLLSVCGAARGPERIGDDGAGHLGGACFRAGARAVVLPSFDLEYESTLKSMDVFHRRLARGDSPARAMLAARRALASSSRDADPTRWAVIHVLGLGQQPLFERRSDRGLFWTGGLVLAVLAVLVLGGAALLRRRRRADA